MSALEEKYIVPTEVKLQILQKERDYWRNYKKDLLRDPYPNDCERLTHCSSSIRMEDWERFVAKELTEEAKSRQEKGKKLRTLMVNPHTTGRTGVARMTEKLEKIRAIISNDPWSTSLDIDNDPVAQIFGKDHGGRLLGMGPGVSKSSLIASGPARKRLHDEEVTWLSLQDQFDTFKADIEKKIDQLISQMAAQSSHASVFASCGTPQSNQRSSLPTQLAPTSQKCDILLSGGRVVGVGSVMRGGDPPPEGFLWVVVNLATKENAFLMCPEQSNNVLGDVVGCPLLWPTGFVRRL